MDKDDKNNPLSPESLERKLEQKQAAIDRWFDRAQEQLDAWAAANTLTIRLWALAVLIFMLWYYTRA